MEIEPGEHVHVEGSPSAIDALWRCLQAQPEPLVTRATLVAGTFRAEALQTTDGAWHLLTDGGSWSA